MRSGFLCALLLVGAFPFSAAAQPVRRYGIDDLVRLAQAQNPEIAIARKKLEAAHGGEVEAHAGYLPGVVSRGLYRRRERADDSRLRPDDYSASLRVVQNLYTGGGVSNENAIARLAFAKQEDELAAVSNRVTMEVRLAFYELLLNREKIHLREQSVEVLRGELKSENERLSAGTVGPLDARRAEVALANEEPELIQAQTDLRNSYLHLADLCGLEEDQTFDATGSLRYEPRHPDLAAALMRAATDRPEIRSAQKDIAIETHQLEVDRSASRPHLQAFTGYEVYSERDPLVGPEFNHGYVVGVNANWNIFDGFATRGRMEATRARRAAAELALKALKIGIQSEVRSAFLDLQQADSVLAAQAKNVRTADEAFTFAQSNLAAGLGTQLDVLQSAEDVTRTQTTRLSAIYLHNAALARLDRAMGDPPPTGANDAKEFAPNEKLTTEELARPPAKLGIRK